jgi:hypothetical protein
MHRIVARRIGDAMRLVGDRQDGWCVERVVEERREVDLPCTGGESISIR